MADSELVEDWFRNGSGLAEDWLMADLWLI
jgi:hypothetical protein